MVAVEVMVGIGIAVVVAVEVMVGLTGAVAVMVGVAMVVGVMVNDFRDLARGVQVRVVRCQTDCETHIGRQGFIHGFAQAADTAERRIVVIFEDPYVGVCYACEVERVEPAADHRADPTPLAARILEYIFGVIPSPPSGVLQREIASIIEAWEAEQ